MSDNNVADSSSSSRNTDHEGKTEGLPGEGEKEAVGAAQDPILASSLFPLHIFGGCITREIEEVGGNSASSLEGRRRRREGSQEFYYVQEGKPKRRALNMDAAPVAPLPEHAKALKAEGRTEFVASCTIPTEMGMFNLRSYHTTGKRFHEPVVVYKGDLHGEDGVVVRVHDQCVTSEVLGSLRCDCKEQLDASLKYIHKHGGAVIYLQQEGRGIGLANKVAAYALQETGMDTVEANRHLGFEDDERTYECVPAILQDLGIQSVRLMTNNPYKTEWLKALGVNIVGCLPMSASKHEHNRSYLETKVGRMGHQIDGI